MAESLRRGIAAVPPDNAALVMLADMPEIETADLLALIDAHAESGGAALVQAAGADGTPGHPVLFPADCLADFAALAGDTGARAILRENRHRRRLVPLAGRRALVDLDTPEDWAAWRARR
jgi:CTP:molybdopterin cytidylyltransferase MocA